MATPAVLLVEDDPAHAELARRGLSSMSSALHLVDTLDTARSFGLDEISFRGSGEVQDRVLAVGKRFSDKLYLSYEQGIGTVTSSLVKLDYALSRRWSARIETGTSTGGGIFYRFSWD